MEIDYSAVPQPIVTKPSTWKAPRHVFFGKKDPETGSMEDEPTYSYVAVPAMMYKEMDGKISAKIANTQAELTQMSGDGWKDSPAKFGHIGAPSFEQINEMAAAKDAKSSTLTLNKKAA
jgi:hypothetical protein